MADMQDTAVWHDNDLHQLESSEHRAGGSGCPGCLGCLIGSLLPHPTPATEALRSVSGNLRLRSADIPREEAATLRFTSVMVSVVPSSYRS